MKAFEESPRLEKLLFARTLIGDEHVARLEPLHQLKHLHLRGTQITSGSLKYIGEMSNLVSLEIGNTRVTHEQLNALIKLPHLQYLDLSETSMNDSSIENLKALRGLREFVLIKTDFTKSGQLELREALPQCNILFEGQTSRPWPNLPN